MLYLISTLLVVVCAFLISLCIQMFRIEKSLIKLSYIVEDKVSKLYAED